MSCTKVEQIVSSQMKLTDKFSGYDPDLQNEACKHLVYAKKPLDIPWTSDGLRVILQTRATCKKGE